MRLRPNNVMTPQHLEGQKTTTTKTQDLTTLSTIYALRRQLLRNFALPLLRQRLNRVSRHVDCAVCSAIQRRKSGEPPSMGSTTNAGLA